MTRHAAGIGRRRRQCVSGRPRHPSLLSQGPPPTLPTAIILSRAHRPLRVLSNIQDTQFTASQPLPSFLFHPSPAPRPAALTHTYAHTLPPTHTYTHRAGVGSVGRPARCCAGAQSVINERRGSPHRGCLMLASYLSVGRHTPQRRRSGERPRLHERKNAKL